MEKRDMIPVPERAGVGRLEVIQFDDRTVTFMVPMIQSEYESDGGCSTTVVGPSGDSAGFLILTCDAGATGVINKLRVEVLGVVGEAAVLRLGIAGGAAV